MTRGVEWTPSRPDPPPPPLAPFLSLSFSPPAPRMQPLRPGTDVHNRACFEIQKQAFLEQLENKGDGDNATMLVKVGVF